MRATGRTVVATALALIGFAANSILCRMALGSREIDPWTFTLVRVTSGAIVLAGLARAMTPNASTTVGDAAQGRASTPVGDALQGRASTVVGDAPKGGASTHGSWLSAAALFVYAAAFSLAYLHVSAGVGALVLFASVQVTMIGWGVVRGERPRIAEWIGVAIALVGLAYLTLPAKSGDSDPRALASMAVAGIAWGAYSLRGRASRDPLATTADNFLIGVVLVLLAWIAARPGDPASPRGLALAVASGAIASGLGYTLWYLALPSLTAARAAVLQLSVPLLAAAAGVVLLGEQLSLRLAVSAALILGGVAVAIGARKRTHGLAARAPDGGRTQS